MAETSVPSSVSRLRTVANVAAVLILVQLALGVMITVGTGGSIIRSAHSGVAYLTVLAGIVAAVLAWSASKYAGSKGVFFHALSLPILALVQIGLAEMDLRLVHIILGVLTVVAYVGLVPMANKLTARASVQTA
jgi:hypothetical protein